MKTSKNLFLILSVSLICTATIIVFDEHIPRWETKTVTLSSTTIGGTIIRKDEALIKSNTRNSGETYIYLNGSWKVIQDAPIKLDSQNIALVTGNAGFDENQTFTAHLYNGTDYRISAVTLIIDTFCTTKANNYHRKYYQSAVIEPYSEVNIQFNLTKPSDQTNFTWNIDSLYGVHENTTERPMTLGDTLIK